MKDSKCRICGENTLSIFNIDFKMVHICESCATNIFLQQAVWYTKQEYKEEKITCQKKQ